jgi:hypothetical protein
MMHILQQNKIGKQILVRNLHKKNHQNRRADLIDPHMLLGK